MMFLSLGVFVNDVSLTPGLGEWCSFDPRSWWMMFLWPGVSINEILSNFDQSHSFNARVSTNQIPAGPGLAGSPVFRLRVSTNQILFVATCKQWNFWYRTFDQLESFQPMFYLIRVFDMDFRPIRSLKALARANQMFSVSVFLSMRLFRAEKS
jgi:hypothetical protein